MSVPPKDRKHGRTPNLAGDWTEVPDVPFDDPRPLPPSPGHSERSRAKWHPLVVAWWKTASTMPHCVLWREEDWGKLLELAYMKDEYFKSAKKPTSTATEIRRQEDALGIGLKARNELKIRYRVEKPAAGDGAERRAPTGSTVTPFDREERRQRVLGKQQTA